MAADQGWFYKELGRRLRDARKHANVSQESLSHSAGLSRTSIINIEKGRQPVDVYALCQMATSLGVEVVALLPEVPAIAGDRFLRKLPHDEREIHLKFLRIAATAREGKYDTELPRGKAGSQKNVG